MDNNILHDYIFTNLKVISKIDTHSKLIIRNGNIYIEDGKIWYQFAKRWIFGDDRYGTIQFIKTIIQTGFNYSTTLTMKYRDSQDKLILSTLQTIKEDFKNTTHGIEKLKETYNEDLVMVSNLEIINNGIEEHIKELEIVISGH
tara:strand:+ start:5614 stop:6045 length:432 start_codon:yes stop_codon:yes gene_type:complete